jgi:DNA (cytosine-5)-methyltransferase 1
VNPFCQHDLRQGLDDPRGKLAFVLIGVADRYRLRWLVRKNVPGILSSGKGREFGAFFVGPGDVGYGWAA